MWRKMAGLSLAIVAVVLFTGTMACAAETIGVIDWQALGPKHPAFESTNRQIQQIVAQKQREAMEAADKEPDPAKKSEIVQSKLREVAREEQRLLEPIINDCDKAIRVVAGRKKLTIVLDKIFVRLGGVDITLDVIQEMNK